MFAYVLHRLVVALLITISVNGPRVALAAVGGADEGAAQVRVPAAVRDFLADHFARLDNERADYGHIDAPEYTLLFASPALDWRDHRSRAWVIGYRIGRDGNGMGPINRLAVVVPPGVGDDRQGLCAQLPAKCTGDDGVAFELRPGVWAFAVSNHEGRHASCDVKVFTLEAAPRQLLEYRDSSPSVEALDARRWYSVLYFTDTDGDGAKDILVDRTVRDWIRGEKWKEYEQYRWDENRHQFGPAIQIAEGQFKMLLEKADQKGDVTRFEQQGPLWPYVDSAEERGLKTLRARPAKATQ